MKESLALLLCMIAHIILAGPAFVSSNRVRASQRSTEERRASATEIVSILTDLVNRFTPESVKELTLGTFDPR